MYSQPSPNVVSPQHEIHDLLEDNELILRLKAGDKHALRLLMGRYKQKLYLFAWRNLGNEDAARDVVQEAFVRLYFNCSKFDPHYKFRTWLYQITLNLCRDYRRRARKYSFEISIETLGSDGNGGWEDSGENIDATIQSREQLALLKKHILLLPNRLKEAFVLYALEDHSQNECAEILGVSAKTVETRVYRARRILAKKLSHNFEG
jgi:RNA polymerase sigma factor (sigma-70 family)